MSVFIAKAPAAATKPPVVGGDDIAPPFADIEDDVLIRKGLATGTLVGIETLIAIGRRLSPALRAQRAAALAQLWHSGVKSAIDESLLADAVVRQPKLARRLAASMRRRSSRNGEVLHLR